MCNLLMAVIKKVIKGKKRWWGAWRGVKGAKLVLMAATRFNVPFKSVT